jgi:hypothetical protein
MPVHTIDAEYCTICLALSMEVALDTWMIFSKNWLTAARERNRD